jgi:hypothetical protein
MRHKKKPNLNDFSPEYRSFVYHEVANKDTIDVKKVYIDMAGNVAYGVLLSQIVYWHLPDKHGVPKQRKFKDDQWWVAKGYGDWWKEARITRDQANKGVITLRKRGFIETRRWKFDGSPTIHIRLTDTFFKVFEMAIEFFISADDDDIQHIFWHKELKDLSEMDFAFWRDRFRSRARTNSSEGENYNREYGREYGREYHSKEKNGATRISPLPDKKSPQKGVTPTPVDLYDAIEKYACQNLNRENKTTRKQLDELQEKYGVTPQSIADFVEWWKKASWQWEKKPGFAYPTVQNMVEEWPKFLGGDSTANVIEHISRLPSDNWA